MAQDWTGRIARSKPLSPRVRQAVMLYQAGIVPTKAKAADAVGLNRTSMYLATSPKVADPQIAALTNRIDQMVYDATLSTAGLIDTLSREAIGHIGKMMTEATREEIKLRAAIDLADRGRETSKIQKHQVESFTLSGKDAKALADALVRSQEARRQYDHLETEDFVKVETNAQDALERWIEQETTGQEVNAQANAQEEG